LLNQEKRVSYSNNSFTTSTKCYFGEWESRDLCICISWIFRQLKNMLIGCKWTLYLQVKIKDLDSIRNQVCDWTLDHRKRMIKYRISNDFTNKKREKLQIYLYNMFNVRHFFVQRPSNTDCFFNTYLKS
jgi:hypothetical protein